MKAQNKTGSGKANKKGIFSGLVSKVIGKNRTEPFLLSNPGPKP